MIRPATVYCGGGNTWGAIVKTERPDSIALDDTVLNFECYYDEPRIITKGEGKLRIQGGVHVEPLIVCNAQHVEIVGNVFSLDLVIPRTAQNDSKSMSLRGFWGCANAGFRGNLGLDFDMPVMDTKKLEHHLERESKKVWSANKPTPGTPLPSVIFKAQLVSYSLVDYLGFKTEKAETMYIISSFEVAWNVLNKATEIRQFCAYKDIHTRPNCRCALYHGLLLTGDPLATAYYLKAHPSLNHLAPVTVKNVPVKHMEELLEEKVIAITQQYDTRDKLAEYVKGNILTRENFKAHLNEYGVGDPRDLCYPHKD